MSKSKSTRRFRISPALVLSSVALFAALSGAAVALPGKNTVNSGDIKNETVKSIDLRDGRVKTQDLKDGGVKSQDIEDDGVTSDDLQDGAVKAAEIGDGIQSRTNSVVVGGGAAENGRYLTKSVTASCAPGEELISGSGHWANGSDEELFLQEIYLNHNAETVYVAGGNDSGTNRTLFAVAHCLST